MTNYFKPLSLAVAFALAASQSGCAMYAKVMGSMPLGGSVHAVNAMSVPVCKVTVYSTSDPGATYDNERGTQVLLGPGAESDLSYPIAKDERGMPKTDMKYGMRVFGCENTGYSMKPGRQLADNKSVDVHQQVVLR